MKQRERDGKQGDRKTVLVFNLTVQKPKGYYKQEYRGKSHF